MVVFAGVVIAIVVAVASKRDANVAPMVPPHVPQGSLDEGEVRALLGGGQKIEAIKLVRERTGMGLKEAKDYVDRLEVNAPGTGAAFPEVSRGASMNVAEAEHDEQVQALLRDGNKLGAIKRVMELTGLGLKEAKELVDAMERSHPPARSS